MSLTHQAYQERKWGPFPTLRKALEQKDLSGECYGLTSADDDAFDFMHRLIEISILVCAHKDRIKELATSGHDEALREDLGRLESLLLEASSFFKYRAKTIHDLYWEFTEYRDK